MKHTVIHTIMIPIALFLSTALCSPGHTAENISSVNLELTYPAGKSPRVFTEGWVFGAHCIVNPGPDQQDISDSVQWSGTATFHPATGGTSRPVFHTAGQNTIVLTVVVDDQTIEKKFTITATHPDTYASIADLSHCPVDAHGCPLNVVGNR